MIPSRRFILTLPIALALTGCVEIEQTVTVDADGHMIIVSRQSMETEALTTQDQTTFCSQEASVKNGVSISHELSRDASMLVCSITMTGHVDDIAADFSANKEEYDEILEKTGNPARTEFFRQGDVYVYRESFALATLSSEDEHTEFNRAFAQTFVGRAFSVSMTAPEIISSSGTVSEDSKSVDVRMPFLDESGMPVDIEFEVRFSL